MTSKTTRPANAGNGAGTAHHPLTEKDRDAVAAMRKEVAPFKGTMGEPSARAPFDDVMEHTPAAIGVTYEKGSVGGVPGIWCKPKGARPDAKILYLHGGAYLLGSAGAYQHFVGQIASRANAAAFIAEYRLAPEHPFPAAVEDAKAAYRGMVAEAKGGACKIALAGDSAGGGLALALLSLVRADALAPSGAVVLSPWIDLALTGASHQDRAEDDPLLTKDMLAKAAASYLGGHDPRDPRASALYGDLAGLPPIQLHVGTSEILLDDTRRYAERARAAGVDAVAHLWEGMPHVFPSSVGAFEAAGSALNRIGRFLDDRFSGRAEIPAVRTLVPPDDPNRTLTVVDREDASLRHVSIVGDTYTILLSGAETAGRYCLIEMNVPPCGGPGPHRHDFEECFTLLDGEIQLTFRGEKHIVKAGMTVNVPANAPHFFTNVSGKPSRMLCMCTPAGQEDFFLAIGDVADDGNVVAPELTETEKKAFFAKADALAPKYRTELLKP